MKLFGYRIKRHQLIILAIIFIIFSFLDFELIKSSLDASSFQFWMSIAMAIFALFSSVGMPFGMIIEFKRTSLEKKREIQISDGRIKFKEIDYDSISYYIDHLTIVADGKERKFYYYHLINRDVLSFDKEAFKNYTGRKE